MSCFLSAAVISQRPEPSKRLLRSQAAFARLLSATREINESEANSKIRSAVASSDGSWGVRTRRNSRTRRNNVCDGLQPKQQTQQEYTHKTTRYIHERRIYRRYKQRPLVVFSLILRLVLRGGDRSAEALVELTGVACLDACECSGHFKLQNVARGRDTAFLQFRDV